MNDLQFSPAIAAATEIPHTGTDRGRTKSLREKVTTMFSFLNDAASGSSHSQSFSHQSGSSSRNKFNMRKFKGYFNKTVVLPLLVFGVFVAIAGYLIINGINNGTQTVLGEIDERVDIKKAKAQHVLNKQFLFPLKDDKGAVVSQLKFVVENAELRDEIIVKGKRATAVKGRTFLIVNIKITNDFDRPISINSRDYVRLIVNNSAEKLAPDIHNDPVEIQAISTKYTRLGFPINDTDKNLAVQIGEISGSKEVIKLNLK